MCVGVCVCVCVCYDPGGSRPRPMIFACLFCLLSRKWGAGVQQVYPMIGGATKALSRLHSWSVGLEFWIGRWCLDRNWICGYSLDLGILVGFGFGFGFGLLLSSSSSFALYYHLTDFTLHLLFLSTTLTFTTRFPIII